MNTVLLTILLLAQGGVTAPVAQGGVITGRILALDGTPVANKRIAAEAVLERVDADLGASMLAGISQTGRDGRFRLENIPPGRYYIVLDPLDLPSYYPGVSKKARADIVSVAEGSLIAGFDFKMPDFDGGKVFGKLAAPPVPLTSPVRVAMFSSATPLSPNVAALPSSSGSSIAISIGGRVQVFTSSSSVSTGIYAPVNADGTFELPKVRSGSYTISTSPVIGVLPAYVEIDDVDVTGVELAAASDSVSSTNRGISVRGRVVENPYKELLAQLNILVTGHGSWGTFSAKTPVKPDGTFIVNGVPSGTFTVMTVPSPNVSKHTILEVANHNIEDVEVVPPYTIEVPGHIEIEGGGDLQQASSGLTIDAYHVDTSGFRSEVHADGSFKLNLLGGDNRITLRNVPTEYALVSITYGSTDLLRQPLIPDLGNADGVKVVLAPAPANSMHKVRGQVTGMPAVAIGSATRIVLTGAWPGHHVAETTVHPDGTFEFRRVPGDLYTARVTGAAFESETTFVVIDTDVDGIRMNGNVRSEIAGHVTIVDRNGTNLPGLPFYYMTAQFASPAGTIAAPVRTDGTFTLPLYGGEYSFGTNKLPEGYTVKSATAGDTDLLKGKLTNDGRPIPDIVVTLEYRPKSNP